ncbi:hypothetical protein DFH07DRAFT_100328 [Mycena maculata]|uniref:Uncharacterized protein n=1 Tax=Mycena maculata TaxID=230809 RepID=A0AAD7JY83_9AGAR|nr:hypothetical protein DFH07DRAFT_100328 [Mycena maculata]
MIICEVSTNRTSDGILVEGRLVQILNLNLHIGTLTNLFENLYQCEPSYYGAMRLHVAVEICGNLACLREPAIDLVCMIDWSRSSHLKLAFRPEEGAHLRVNLIPNHVLFMVQTDSLAPEIGVVSDSAFSRHWRHTTDSAVLDVVYISELRAIRESLAVGNSVLVNRWFGRMNAYENPLTEGAYTLWVVIQAPACDSRYQPIVCKYRLSIANGTRPPKMWRRMAQTVNHMGQYPGLPPLSYSGHQLLHMRTGDVFSLNIAHPNGDSSQVVALDLPDPDEYIPARISTYTGVLTYYCWPKKSVIIAYFK